MVPDRCRHKHVCGVAVTIAGIRLRGREFEIPLGYVYFLNFSWTSAIRGNENENELCGEGE